MALHEVTWTRTESFTAVIDIPDDELIPGDWLEGDGDELLAELEEPNARDATRARVFYNGCDREIDRVSREDEAVAR